MARINIKSRSISSFGKVIMVVLVIALGVQITGTMGQADSTCANQLGSLNVCAPFVLPAQNSAPSTECCGALQAVDHACLCNTFRVASQLPSACKLTSLNCGV